jgi:hypothetical protein
MTFRRQLTDGFHEYLLLEFHEPLPERHEPEVLGGAWQLESRLRGLAQDTFNLRTLRDMVYTHTDVGSYEPVSTDQVVKQVATLLARGQLRLVRAPLPEIPAGRLFPRLELVPPPDTIQEEEPRRLMLQVLHDSTEDPISDLTLTIELPDGSEQELTTDSSGRIEVAKVPPGRVKVSSVLDGATRAETLAFMKSGVLPSKSREDAGHRTAVSGKFLARIITHKVSDGETLESIAESYSVTVDQLTRFNWNTTDPEELQWHLQVEVGCTREDADGRLEFSSSDEPGILYVARPLRMDWVALEERHVLRVRMAREWASSPFSV